MSEVKKRYRPKGWENPYPEVIGDSYSKGAYEAGADAMLEALRKGSIYVEPCDISEDGHLAEEVQITPPLGYVGVHLVAIPEDGK